MATDDQAPPAASSNEIVETIDATLEPGQALRGLELLRNKRYNPDEHRDKARALITYWLLALLTLLIVLAFVYVCRLKEQPTFEQLKNMVELLLGPVVALVSAATGFYFGAAQATAASKGP